MQPAPASEGKQNGLSGWHMSLLPALSGRAAIGIALLVIGFCAFGFAYGVGRLTSALADAFWACGAAVCGFFVAVGLVLLLLNAYVSSVGPGPTFTHVDHVAWKVDQEGSTPLSHIANQSQVEGWDRFLPPIAFTHPSNGSQNRN